MQKKEAKLPFCLLLERSGRDSNPRAVARKLISSQPRYDHFDTAAYVLYKRDENLYGSSSAPLCPVAVPEMNIAIAQSFRPLPPPFCSLHPQKAALANVAHFDTAANIVEKRNSPRCSLFAVRRGIEPLFPP